MTSTTTRAPLGPRCLEPKWLRTMMMLLMMRETGGGRRRRGPPGPWAHAPGPRPWDRTRALGPATSQGRPKLLLFAWAMAPGCLCLCVCAVFFAIAPEPCVCCTRALCFCVCEFRLRVCVCVFACAWLAPEPLFSVPKPFGVVCVCVFIPSVLRMSMFILSVGLTWKSAFISNRSTYTQTETRTHINTRAAHTKHVLHHAHPYAQTQTQAYTRARTCK